MKTESNTAVSLEPSEKEMQPPQLIASQGQAGLPLQIAASLVKAQRVAHAVTKDRKMQGASFSYNFAGAEAVIESARAALAEAQLGVFVSRWSLEPGYDQKPRLFARFYVVHESGASWETKPLSFPVLVNAGRPGDKAEASALTYITNYFLTRLLNLPRIDGDDVSARDDSHYRPPSSDQPGSEGHKPGIARTTPKGRTEGGGFQWMVPFGPFKGKKFTELAAENLSAADKVRSYIAKSVEDPKKQRFRKQNEALLEEIDAVLEDLLQETRDIVHDEVGDVDF